MNAQDVILLGPGAEREPNPAALVGLDDGPPVDSRGGAKPPIVGLCGSIGAGKSTVAGALAELHGYARSWGFAHRLKLVLLDVYGPMGLERRHLFGTQAEKNEPLPRIVGPDGEPTTARALAEWIGTQGFRHACPDTWVDHLLEQERGPLLVIEDVRFPNEFDGIRKRGGEVWHVIRVGGPPQEVRNHESDKLWRPIPKDDHVTARFGDVDELRAEASRALARAMQRRA